MKEILTCKAKDDWFAADGGVVRPDMRDMVDRTDRLALPFLQQYKQQHCQTAAVNTSCTDLFPLNRVRQKYLKGSILTEEIYFFAMSWVMKKLCT